jgi:DsbC/DsbD-like thiol-disulfide interchange protein
MKILIAAVAAAFSIAVAQTPGVTSKLTFANHAAKRGQVVSGSVVMTVPAGYHAYAPSDKGDTFKVEISPVEKATFKVVQVKYPAGTMADMQGEQHSVYRGVVTIPVKIKIPANAKPKSKYTVKLELQSQICADESGMCLRPTTDTLTQIFTIKAK